jgi:hypothetical protein
MHDFVFKRRRHGAYGRSLRWYPTLASTGITGRRIRKFLQEPQPMTDRRPARTNGGGSNREAYATLLTARLDSSRPEELGRMHR